MRKQRKIKAKNAGKNQSENKKSINLISTPRDEIFIRRCETKMKVVNQKDDKNKPIDPSPKWRWPREDWKLGV